jgi:hypothetical protein
MAKGGGCENKSQFRMFNPTESKETVAEWIVDVVRNAGANACPPFIVGVGIGGNFEQSCLLSKKSLLRTIDGRHSDSFYANMEADLLKAVNMQPASVRRDWAATQPRWLFASKRLPAISPRCRSRSISNAIVIGIKAQYCEPSSADCFISAVDGVGCSFFIGCRVKKKDR